MTKINQVYRCSICGNVVEVLHAGAGQLVCCGENMDLLEEKREDDGQEKHVPVIEKEGDSVKVRVGSIPHPMEEDHYIEWIELVAGDKVFRKFLKPGNSAEAEFTGITTDQLSVREYCNVHGLWKKE